MMIPPITDALIAKVVQTGRMVESGRTYWNQGRVRQLGVVPERGHAHAQVKGSEEHPYQVELHFVGTAASRLETTCTCPVGQGCKHVAASLFALRAKMEKASRPAAGGIAETSAIQTPLPPALSQWLGAMAPLVREAAAAGAPMASRAVLYVVRAQTLTGKTRMSKAHPVASLAPPGRPLRLHVEALDVAFDMQGRPVHNSPRLLAHHFTYSAHGRASHVTGEDQLIVRRLEPRLGEIDGDGCLTGVGGFELLERIIATGRARWGGARGPALHREATVPLALGWGHGPLGEASLELTAVPTAAVIALVAPPVLIDPVGGGVNPVDAGVGGPVAEQLLRLPAVPLEAIDALAARWSEAAPPGVPAPPQPRLRDLGVVEPTPVLSLQMESLQIEEPSGSRWSYGRTVRTNSAVARLSFDYGVGVIDASASEDTMLVRTDEALVRFTRDLAAEEAAHDWLISTDLAPLTEYEGIHPSLLQSWDYAPLAPASASDFTALLLYDAEPLRAEGWRVEMAPGFPLRLTLVETDSVEIGLTPSGIDWFDMTLGARVEGVEIDLVPALNRMLSALSPGELEMFLASAHEPGTLLPVPLEEGRVATLEADRLLPMLRALLLLASGEPGAAPGAPPRLARQDLGLLAELETAAGGLRLRGAEPLRQLARALSELRFSPTPLPEAFKATLRPYQQTGLDWLDALGRAGLGGLLADDMGLGKTVQTLAHVAVLKARGELKQPVMIVAPTSVLPNWQAEAARFAPELSVLLLHGPGRHHRRGDISAHDLVLTSYPLLARDQAQLAEMRFALVVFDEAHNLKNPRTAGHAAARALAAERKIALTGTPVENRLADAWALFEIVTPGLLGTRSAFARTYRGLGEPGGDPTAQGRLARKLKPFLLRRTKEAVAPDLPAKSVVPLSITLEPAQMALHESQRLLMHERVRDEIARVGLMRAQIIVLTALTRLRQICCDPRLIQKTGKAAPSAKLARLIELLEEMVPEGRQIILFSQFTSMLDLIKPELDRLGVGWVELTGRTKDRKTPVTRFQSGEVPLILVSLKAGGTGLNLTAADTVVLYDPWWNPAIEAQAIDRAHRIGQTKPVFVYRMVASGTIEEKILALQQRKATLAQALWSEDAASAAQLSEEDIAFLLG